MAEIFAGSAEVAAFEAFVMANAPLSAPEIKRMAQVPHMSAYRILRRMAADGVLRAYDRQGRAIRYVLNGENQKVQIFAKAFRLAMLDDVEKDATIQAPALTEDAIVAVLTERTLAAAPNDGAYKFRMGVIESETRAI